MASNSRPRAPDLADSPDIRTLEVTSAVLYRDVFLTLHPSSPLPRNLTDRLTIDHNMGLSYCPTSQPFIDSIQRSLAHAHGVPMISAFFLERMGVCLNVARLLHRLENLRDFEQDMKPRLVQRLGTVTLGLMMSWEEEVGAWALDWREVVLLVVEGGKEKGKGKGKKVKGG